MGAKDPQRKATNNEKRRRARGNQIPADWQGVAAEQIHRLIVAITNTGGAVRFGYTRDGGAYSVGILGDGDPYTEFIRPSDDVEQYLSDIADDFTGIGVNTGP
jgi:hypothetical protein